jgi:hypothetical protein
MVEKRPAFGHPLCPKCDMGMIVKDGFKLGRETGRLNVCGGVVDYPDLKSFADRQRVRQPVCKFLSIITCKRPSLAASAYDAAT